MCSVTGVVTTNGEVPASVYGFEQNIALYHRGPERSGMATMDDDGRIRSQEDKGPATTVFSAEDLEGLVGNMAIGHNLYSTNGIGNGQPIVDEGLGFAFVHNGNLPITRKLDEALDARNIRSQDMNDSKKMGTMIAQYIREGHDLPDAVEKAYPLFRGAFTCIGMHDGLMVAFKDKCGIRPGAIGSFDDGVTVSSETIGLDKINADFQREIAPGEMVIFDRKGKMDTRQIVAGDPKLDMFEYVYFARPDSMLYGQRVEMVRREFGKRLALEHPPLTDNPKNIRVVPIPDTSIPTANAYAQALGLTYEQSIIKDRQAGRTFQAVSHLMRQKALFRKHTIIPELMKGKDLILIDDSIVRFNTLPHIIKLVKSAKPRSITVLVGSAPIGYPDFYGIDTPRQSELGAFSMSPEQMRAKLDILHLGYLSLGGMVESTGLPEEMFNLSGFTGYYPIGIGDNKRELQLPQYLRSAA